MKKIFLSLCTFFTIGVLFAQKEKFDIALYAPPPGWQRIDSNGIRAFMDSKIENNLTSFCQIFIYPSHTSTGSSSGDFQSEWNNHVVKATGSMEKPLTETGKTPDGWEVVTGYANIKVKGITFTCFVVTASGFGKEMTVQVNVAGQSYLPAVQKFLGDFDLDSKAANTNNSQNNMSTNSEGLNNYDFIAPEEWQTFKNGNQIQLSQTKSLDYGCLITIYSSQPSSGNLENDARNIFNQLYGGWEYRYTGDKKENVSKGYNPQGLEYCMIEASMQKKRPDGYYYDFENGQVLVIKNGNQITLVLGRHERGEFTCFCKYRYDYWDRFFNSFTIRNATSQKINDDVSKRIVGSWESIGSGSALMKYIFAANGRYQFIGAYSTTSLITPTMIELKTSGFKGDGAYHFNGNKLMFTKDNHKNNPETVVYRLEKVNHGGTGWKDRLYILDNSGEGGKPNEVCFEKE